MILGFIEGLSTQTSLLLLVCLLAVCFFEAINGFHDTANAVATVIYTRSLKPQVAVVWSGLMNFIGVFFGGVFMAWLLGMFGSKADSGGIGVAMGIVKLMPVNEMLSGQTSETIAMVLAVLFSAIIWNLGTWYFGIPCSSSHTLIGALLGAGFAFSTIHTGAKVNWSKAGEIGWSLLISPFFGFSLAVMLMFLLTLVIKNKVIFKEPDPKKKTPRWIRYVLIFTCTLVSFFHGSNDGQKGVGLLLVVMLAFMPAQFALDNRQNPAELRASAIKIEEVLIKATNEQSANVSMLRGFAGEAHESVVLLDSLRYDNAATVVAARKSVQALTKNLKDAIDSGAIHNPDDKKIISAEIKKLKKSYEFAYTWMIALISICLGIGTMIGWKRIVVTIGEKIGKSHLTYAQGASAELCAAATIGVSTGLGLPVSTTHVLSSGIAGTMVAKGGVKNLQKKTIVNIALAWLLTLPVSMILAGVLYYLLRFII